MKNRTKKSISVLLAGMLVLGLCACGGGGSGTGEKLKVTSGTPSYADDKYIEMAAYCGPRKGGYRFWNGEYGKFEGDPEGGWEGWITKEAFQDYKDCGFTYLISEFDGNYDRSVDFMDSDLYRYMELAEETNIPVVVSGDILTAITSSSDYRLTDDQKASLAEMVSDLSSYRMFKGFTFRDEPSIEMAKTFGAVKDYLDSMKSDLYYFTSFLPIYASDLSAYSKEHTDNREEAYKNYIDAFSDAMGTFAYDSYPLFEDPIHGTTYVREDWFQNLRLVAESAKEKGYDAGITIQSVSEGAPGGEYTTIHTRLPGQKKDITFQLYTALAYGMKYVNYYTYWQHWANNDTFTSYSAMVNYPEEKGGEPIKTDAYYAVKEANAEIQKFDHVFLSFDWEGTMALTAEGKKKSVGLQSAGNYESPRIASATATDEAIIGCMKDKDGYDGYMIVNATDPGKNLSNTVTVAFKEASKALAYINGEEQTITLKDGEYTFDLKAGEGVFVIPIQ